VVGIGRCAPEITKQGGGLVSDADIEIVARVRAAALRFDAQRDVRVRFPSSERRDSRPVTTRENIDKPVEPGKTYRRVFVSTRLTSRLLDEDWSG
jgi:hypothetical protein